MFASPRRKPLRLSDRRDGVIRNDFEYGAFTKNIFEGKGLFTEIDNLLKSNKSVAPTQPAPANKSVAPKKK